MPSDIKPPTLWVDRPSDLVTDDEQSDIKIIDYSPSESIDISMDNLAKELAEFLQYPVSNWQLANRLNVHPSSLTSEFLQGIVTREADRTRAEFNKNGERIATLEEQKALVDYGRAMIDDYARRKGLSPVS